jgi:hypothetical protein
MLRKGLFFPRPRLPAAIGPRSPLFPSVEVGTPLLEFAVVPDADCCRKVQKDQNEHNAQKSPRLVNDVLNHRVAMRKLMVGKQVISVISASLD